MFHITKEIIVPCNEIQSKNYESKTGILIVYINFFCNTGPMRNSWILEFSRS